MPIFRSPRVRALSKTLAMASTLLLGSCASAIVDTLLPDPPPYPDYQSEAAVLDEARQQSAELEAHILAWLDGRGPARIPEELLPDGMEMLDLPYTLVRPEDVRPEDQLIVRPADYRLNQNALRGLYPDPHATYIVGGAVVAPLGHKMVIEGEFPYARFFDIQMSPPTDPAAYYYAKQFGAPEVPIVDVDIDPAPGSINPFRPGANRYAPNRSYRVEFEMVAGKGLAVEPAYREPLHRARGNRRKASSWQFQGPLGYRKIITGHGRGAWDDGTLWIRYYAPDNPNGGPVDPLAGVPLPRVHWETPDGRRYWIMAENAHREERRIINATHRAIRSNPEKPSSANGPAQGWWRENGIFEAGMQGIFTSVGKTSPADLRQGADLVRGLTARGAELPGAGSVMSSNSRVPYISYMSRGINLERDHVAVLTGRLPRHPRTLGGNPRVETGQVRYMSVTLYPEPDWLNTESFGIPHASVMDENIVTDAQGRYMIVYSRAGERPRNAVPQAGATWQDFGPSGKGGFNIRWMTVGPEWRDASIVPDSQNISYGQATVFSPAYDRSLIGVNGQSRLMGDYAPTVHYMSRETFERLGESIKDSPTPIWED